MAKLNVVEMRKGLLQLIARANTALVVNRDAVKLSFEKPILEKPRDAVFLCEKVSKQYPTFKFRIEFLDGNQLVYAEPTTALYQENVESLQDYEVQKLETNIYKVLDSLNAKTYWPSFECVRAYARGFDEMTQTVCELRAQVKRLESLQGEQVPQISWSPFPPPWARRW